MADTNRKRSKLAGTKPPGRPNGAKTEARDVIPVHPSRCRRCGSTERTRYTRSTTRAILGRTPTGEPFNLIHWRRCRCKQCGQARVDQYFELVEKQP